MCSRLAIGQPFVSTVQVIEALSLIGLNRWSEGENALLQALALNPDDFDALANLGVLRSRQGKLVEAIQLLERVVRGRGLAHDVQNLANFYIDSGQISAAERALDAAIARKASSGLYVCRAKLYYISQRWQLALSDFDAALELDTNLGSTAYCFAYRAIAALKLYRWDTVELDRALESSHSNPNDEWLTPLALTLLKDSPSDQQFIAERWTRQRFPPNEALGPLDRRLRGDRIRVGYFSADYKNHPVSQLLSGLLQSHDRGAVELVGLSIGPKVEGTARQFMEGLFERFVDLHGMGDEAAARRVRELELDIAVDLTGHTDHCRPGLFAMRMAPIQVNYLGYAGTMGAPYIDYMMADQVVIPPESRKHFSEKVVYLPHSFFPNDRRWPPMDRVFTRQELGLPEQAMVYCCFNGSQKINARMFEVWARILKAVPQSVLWVSDPGPMGRENLAREAQARGVDAERLVYAPKLPSLSDHIARHRQADLFLDTLPYNAHTTASDALWAGLPLITCMGESFAARVAGSLLKAVGLPELVTERLADYEALAIELGLNAAKREAIKKRLWVNRLTQPLFDSALYARHLEDAYRAMMDRYHAGEEPDHIEVAMRGVNPMRAQDVFRQGLAAHQRNALQEAKGMYEQALELDGAHAGALHFYGVLLAQEGEPEAGLRYLDRAVAAQPGQAELHYNRGKVLKQVGRLDEAEASYKEALRFNPRYADAHHNLGNLYLERNELQAAEDAYVATLELNPKHQDSLDSLSRVGQSLVSQGEFKAGQAVFKRILAIAPDHVKTALLSGDCYQALGDRESALAQYRKAKEIEPSVETCLRLSSMLHRVQDHGGAFEVNAEALRLDPTNPFVIAAYRRMQRHVLDWASLETTVKNLLRETEDQKEMPLVEVVFPFEELLLNDSLTSHREVAEDNMRRRYPPSDVLGPLDRRLRGDRIRVGYFSADYKNHPVSQLLSGLLQSHDRGAVELVGLSIGPKVEGTARQFMEGLFERFVDLHGMGDEAAARRVRELELDIAVDLTGHTDHCRPGLFAMRMAPIQVNYLGYAGTMGAPYIDYMMADQVVIPPESRKHFSEKVVYLPHSFFPNDRRWPPMDRVFTRQELGLPEQAMVYCCFNGSQKINARMFEVWARILKAVPQSVLWVSDPGPMGRENLAREAQARGVDAERLVYAPKLPSLSDHIARHRQADLFLDTLPYNAHTTASDALWAGLPLITCMGESFAARVAGSLLKAVGLPELVTERLADYEALAIELGLNAAKREAIKKRLWVNRLTQPLFDSALYARHLEDAYRAMMDRYHAGEEPDHIEVAMRGVNPMRAQDVFRQGLAAHQRNALQEAKGMYEQALELDGAHAGALHFYGVLLAQEGEPEAGLRYLDRAVAAQPGQAELHYNRGKVLKQVGRLDEAEASYKEALRFNPRYADAHHNLGNLYLERKQWQEAERAYLEALKVDPSHRNAAESLEHLKHDRAPLRDHFALSNLRHVQAIPLRSLPKLEPLRALQLSTDQLKDLEIKILSIDDLKPKS